MKSIIIFSFMIKDLKLKGSELLVYALIYSFSQFGQVCFMRPDTIAIELGLSRAQVFRVLSALMRKNLLVYVDFGYKTISKIDNDSELSDRLEEMIRIAKTPWLDM